MSLQNGCAQHRKSAGKGNDRSSDNVDKSVRVAVTRQVEQNTLLMVGNENLPKHQRWPPKYVWKRRFPKEVGLEPTA